MEQKYNNEIPIVSPGHIQNKVFNTSFINEQDYKKSATKIPFRKRLHAKGILFVTILLAYTAFLGFVILKEWNTPIKQLEEYQRVEQAENALVQADLAAFHVITALFIDLNEQDMKAIVNYFSVLREQHIILDKLFPAKAQSFKKLVNFLPLALENPTNENFNTLHHQLTQAKLEIDSLMSLNRTKREDLIIQYKDHSSRLIITALTLGIIGLALIGAITSLFFAQLTRDLNSLHFRVRHIVEGYRGKPLKSNRKDEVGSLINGVNQMALDLSTRENELEMERRKNFYHEKMIAIESLAGGIAHEIGNPIACISGLAHELQDSSREKLDESTLQLLQSIIDYSDGLAKITQDLSVIASPLSNNLELFDINEQITNICNLLQYDKRWDGINLESNLDNQLGAFQGKKDQFSILVNNLLENALDAVAQSTTEKPTITITTSIKNKTTLIEITDNGRGMNAETLEKAMDPFFSTKPVGKGTGLGLALCWSIAQSHDGNISMQSTVGEGTVVQVSLPKQERGH